MPTLVTGATGFLGGRVTAGLLERGHDVVAVSRPGAAERAAARERQVIESLAAAALERAGAIAACAAALAFVALAASWIPARAATRVNPLDAVRTGV